MNFAPVFRDFRKNVVVALPHQFPLAQRVIVPEAPAHRQISHLAVEHGNGDRRELREPPQILFARPHRFFGKPARRDVHHDPYEACRAALAIAQRPSTGHQPSSRSVRVAHPEFDIQLDSRAGRAPHHFFRVSAVVRVYHLAPRIVGGETAVRLNAIQFPQFVGPHVFVGDRVPFPGARARRIQGQAQTILAQPHGPPCPLAAPPVAFDHRAAHHQQHQQAAPSQAHVSSQYSHDRERKRGDTVAGEFRHRKVGYSTPRAIGSRL